MTADARELEALAVNWCYEDSRRRQQDGERVTADTIADAIREAFKAGYGQAVADIKGELTA